jgi:hypothetical protein
MVRHVTQQRRRIDFGLVQRELAGLDLRQVENRIDDLQQVVAGGFDLVQPVDAAAPSVTSAAAGGSCR